MRRRRALAIVLGGAGALTGALALLVRRRRRRPGELIEAVVRETFPYLHLVPTDLERFAGQFLLGAPLAEARLRQSRTTGDRAEAGELEHAIGEAFLYSTDFFPNGADESRPLRFLALYAPRRSGCQNPFARFDLG